MRRFALAFASIPGKAAQGEVLAGASPAHRPIPTSTSERGRLCGQRIAAFSVIAAAASVNVSCLGVVESCRQPQYCCRLMQSAQRSGMRACADFHAAAAQIPNLGENGVSLEQHGDGWQSGTLQLGWPPQPHLWRCICNCRGLERCKNWISDVKCV